MVKFFYISPFFVNFASKIKNMTQEDKELLLKDLCARLPYGVKIELVIPLPQRASHLPHGKGKEGKHS